MNKWQREADLKKKEKDLELICTQCNKSECQNCNIKKERLKLLYELLEIYNSEIEKRFRSFSKFN